MPYAVDRLLAALDPLPHHRRLRHLALSVPGLEAGGELDTVLDELDRRGPYERRLAALAALVGRRETFLVARLTDPDPVVGGYALRAARTLPVPDDAVEAAHDGASAALRARLARLVLAGGRTALAERLVPRIRATWGDAEAARLLPACSAPFVAALLPEVAHAVERPARLARSHPDAFLDQAGRDLADLYDRWERDGWWQRNAHGLAVLVRIRPDRVLDLLERYGPGTLPHPIWQRVAGLFDADAERTLRWLLSPDRDHQRYPQRLSPGAVRALVRAEPPSLGRFARAWLRHPPHLAALLKAMPLGRRAAFLDSLNGRQPSTGYVPDDLLDVLPRERRWAEVRRWLAEADAEGGYFWWDVLETAAYGPYAEARPRMLDALRQPDAEDRARVWRELLACAGRDGGPDALTDALDLMGRLRNERDPVRTEALDALAGLPPSVLHDRHVPGLDRVLRDALDARDASDAGRGALCRLAFGLVVAYAETDTGRADGRGGAGPAPRTADAGRQSGGSGSVDRRTDRTTEPVGGGNSGGNVSGSGTASDTPATAEEHPSTPAGDGTSPDRPVPVSGRPALAAWALAALPLITGDTGTLVFGPLGATLRRGQEHQVFAAVRPWLETAAGKGDHAPLLGLAAALGRRAHEIPGLQDLLESALRSGSDEAAATAARHWLADPRTREARVSRILEQEPSAAVLPAVREVVARRRTDLLDALLAEEPPYGRFLPRGADRPLPDVAYADRWLPRQQEAAARVARAAVADTSRPLRERAAALLAAGALPGGHGREVVDAYLDAPEVVLAEAALVAAVRPDRPAESLRILLDHAGGDRARVAVHAVGKAAAHSAPEPLAEELAAVLAPGSDAKVTSRKEAVRLAARFLPTARAAALLAAAFRAPGGHPDVRAVIVRAAPGLLGEPGTWEVLEEAARDEPPVRMALVEPLPRALPAAYRARYGRLVVGLSAADDPDVRAAANRALPRWAASTPDVLIVLRDRVTDLAAGGAWRTHSTALADLAGSGAPHPVGGAAEGGLLHTTVTTLLAGVRREQEDGYADPHGRDLPARRRLRSLAESLRAATSSRHVPRAVADLLAGEPGLAAVRARLLVSLVAFDQDAPGLSAQLGELADTVRHSRVAAATVARSLDSRASMAVDGLEDTSAVRTALLGAATGGDTIDGLLAVGMVSGMGARLSWPAEWRDLLRTLRRHADPDVREAALEVTEYEE
ncbi:hypothetical protein ACWGIN_31975 [Streptomyces sp. NPDC054861]